MQGFEILTLFISFFVFLFCVYMFSKDDFVLMRKNISLDQIFHLIFLVSLASFVGGRVLYAVFTANTSFVNPLILAAFLYYPGFSLAGSILGGGGGLALLCYSWNIEKGRVFDIVSLSFLGSFSFVYLPLFFLGSFLKGSWSIAHIIFLLGSGGLFGVFLRLFLKEKLRDGSVSLGSIGLFSLLASMVVKNEFFILLPIAVILLGLLTRQEEFAKKLYPFFKSRTKQ
ncbi:MAG: hypothetical protein A3J69_02570 [Candidatus Levybacteria bacterium RIFCSPHIGHO2_02_FULL_42_12]|nr:MAG: hypothetical protein A2698_00145 [Candidatus Levybacteria bacterium RIFCSPHIGHO2_01_FULL_42_15]OGH33838.1 MAG: hypothetical protein A3J69_02570 [Candidatus Levybacteria bacterium RIFCSPHIGHO2_02_FULL_42_12]